MHGGLRYGDLVEIDVAEMRAVARVRAVAGRRLHLALEPGGYVPWVDGPVWVRRVGELERRAGRILHASSVTVSLELDEERPELVTSLTNAQSGEASAVSATKRRSYLPSVDTEALHREFGDVTTASRRKRVESPASECVAAVELDGTGEISGAAVPSPIASPLATPPPPPVGEDVPC